jgi:prepilin-type processing-associated H-X9-DG protein
MKKIGYIFATLIILGVAVWWIASSIDEAKRRPTRLICANNLHQIGRAAELYESDHTNKMQSFQALKDTNGVFYINQPKLFICPHSGNKPGELSNVDKWTDYKVISGLTTASPPEAVVAFCPPQNHGGKGGNILYNDGSVIWANATDFWKLVKQSKQ